MAKAAADRTPPNNPEAEESLLGAAMLSADALEVLVTDVEPDDFYRPVHGHIATACRTLFDEGGRADPVVIADRLRSWGLLDDVGGLAALLSLQANTPATSNARRYARIILEHATMRRLIGVAGEMLDMAYGVPDDVGEMIDRSKTMLEEIDVPMTVGAPSPNIDQFLSVTEEYDWIVPGLIERTDRTMVTAAEGAGKSTLLRQMAISIAAGMHPFDYYPFEMSTGELPVVQVFDVENSPNQMRRKFRPLREIEGVMRRLHPDRLRIECRPEGIDLTQRHDGRWLQERVASVRPDLVVIGPVYKLYDGDLNKEELIRKVLRVLDLIRVRYGCAMLIEAHSPHGEPGARRDLRPIGSSIWKRWPEFGYGLAPDRQDENMVHFQPWRGARDERQWPTVLVRSEPWPWGQPGQRAGRAVHRAEDEPAAVYEPDDGFF